MAKYWESSLLDEGAYIAESALNTTPTQGMIVNLSGTIDTEDPHRAVDRCLTLYPKLKCSIGKYLSLMETLAPLPVVLHDSNTSKNIVREIHTPQHLTSWRMSYLTTTTTSTPFEIIEMVGAFKLLPIPVKRWFLISFTLKKYPTTTLSNIGLYKPNPSHTDEEGFHYLGSARIEKTSSIGYLAP